jgi:hypothetical protein
MRALCASTLAFEAFVFALSVPVMIKVKDVDPALAFALGFGLAVACVLVAGALRSRWAYWLGHAIQVAMLAMAILVGQAMVVLGLIFVVLWVAALVLGRRIEDAKARWADHPDAG